MSIDYQLYQMLNTTQIVIPKLHMQQNNMSQPLIPESFSLSTPPKLAKSASQLSWRKKQSAFKKFRERNYQKNQIPASQQSQRQNKVEQEPCKTYRLIQRQGPIQQTSPNKASQTRIERSVCYYDPNMAPLYSEGNCEGISNQLTATDVPLIRTVSRSTLKIQQERPQKLCPKIEPLPSKRSSQVYHPQLQIQRTDDPFIIVRHNSPQKSKTKFIKKQKQKCTPIKKQNVKVSESAPEILEMAQNRIPKGSFRSSVDQPEQHEEYPEAIDLEVESPSESQSGMEWQQQKYISCD